MHADAADAARHLRDQWTVLDRWLRDLRGGIDRAAERPSVLEGWSVGELVSHLGQVWETLASCEPAPAGTVPLSLAEYLAAYPDVADEITSTMRDLDARLAPDRLRGVEELARQGFARLDQLASAGAVQGRRGPITLHDMVASRLLELVVHADDLARSFPEVVNGPVDPGALDVVAAELLRVVVARGGWSLEVKNPLLWARLATGREPYHVDRLADALAPVYTSEAVPDLGRMLPLV
ncbi:maleylpyruvate isomerase N-terminal domain-containing protein [Cellulosimicrobium sp. NPDC057127]|uniref:maleylpyruvate isomerase N-terminal domain-containing protein n=1 Tax=Cellulosimicrobium sp. NPDC057127 TaxID=3346026 RepID=UPI003625E036